jgi:hypothetical protein
MSQYGLYIHKERLLEKTDYNINNNLVKSIELLSRNNSKMNSLLVLFNYKQYSASLLSEQGVKELKSHKHFYRLKLTHKLYHNLS